MPIRLALTKRRTFRSTVLLGIAFSTAPLGYSQLKIQAVVNSASFQPGVPDGGALASVFVSGLSGEPGLVTAPPSEPLPQELSGVQVTVNGWVAPILAVYIPTPDQNAYGQVNFQVPAQRYVTGVDYLTVSQEGNPCNCTDRINPLPRLPFGGFFSDQNGFAIAQHGSDRSFVTVQNPAHPGETIIAYGTGFFSVWPPPPIAFPVPEQPLFLADMPYPGFTGYLFLQSPPRTVVSGDQFQGSCADTPALSVTFEGLAASFVGVEQITFIVPSYQQPGDWALFFNIGTNVYGGGCDPIHDPISSLYVKLPVR